MAKDFVNDAFAHCKFIGYSPQAMPILEKAGIGDDLNDGCVSLAKPAEASGFIEAWGELSVWAREALTDLSAEPVF